MYQYERNSRVYMKGDGENSAGGRKSALSSSSRPSSRSPLEELNKESPHHRSSQGIHTNGTNLTNGTTTHHSQTKNLKDSQQRATSSELGDLTAPGETRTKTQMARAFQESQELYKSADSRAGLQTVKTRRVLKKTTTITKGENEKELEDNSNFREILLRWAQKTTDGYPGCKVTDLTSSWRDGLAFNAIIHRNRPDLLDYRACQKKTTRENIEQAFNVADRDLGVARLLEVADVDCPKPDEKSMITYLSQLYELFPNPPERNPLLDEEMIRRIDGYKELADKLLRWMKDSTCKLEERKFPKAIGELRKLKEDNERWRAQEVPPKEHDKARLASVAREIYKMAQDVGVRIDPELHMDNLDYHWDRMLKAHKSRSKALDDEIAKAERLRALLDKLLADMGKLDARLDSIARDMDEEERRVGRLENLREAEQVAPAKLQKFSEELADCGIKIDAIKRLADEFISEAGRGSPDSLMVRDKLADLDAKYKRLLARLNRLHEQLEQVLQRLREDDESRRRAQRQREAEAKLRLKLDAMKRELDDLERRIDSMAPVARDVPTITRQLAEMQQFDADVKVAREHLNEIIRLAESMIADDLIANPVMLRSELQSLKEQLARIEDKQARRMRDFEANLAHAERQKEAEEKVALKLEAIKRKLDDLERRIDSMAPVARDLPTLERQIQELKDFDGDVKLVRAELADLIRLSEDLIADDLIVEPQVLRNKLKALKEQLARIEDKAAKRARALQEAMNRAEAQRAAEAKFQLKLDAIRKELEGLERRLRSMAPVARDLETLQQQLAEMEDFCKALEGAKGNLADAAKTAEELIRDELIADPAKLRQSVKELKELANKIDEDAQKRLRDIQDAMGRVSATDAIQEVSDWLERARKVLVDEENVHGDLDTVNALCEQHKAFEAELAAKQPAMDKVRRMEAQLSPASGAQVRDKLNALSEQWKAVERAVREKSAKLTEALRAAEQLHAGVHALLEWLAEAEMKLRFSGPLADDEPAAKAELAEHEKLERQLAAKGQAKDSTLKLAKDILERCHPDAEPVIKHWQNIIGSRWDEIDAWAKQRGARLADHLRSLLELLELVEELLAWLARHEGRLLAEQADSSLPEAPAQLAALIEQHASFMDELRKREPQVDRAVKVFAAKSAASTSKLVLSTSTTKAPATASGSGLAGGRQSAGARAATPTRTSYAAYRDEYPEVRQARAKLMLDKWRSVWQLALDRMQRLKERSEHLNELERLENFDFDLWRRRFLAWVSGRKERLTDFFRALDDHHEGRVPIEAFVSGLLRAKFESSRLELERAADTFDRNHDGHIDNKEFLAALRPDKPITDDELIQDEVQRQVSRCSCAQRYRAYHVGENRYRFGESQKLRLVRILRSTVMVRVGGGWEPLASFLQKNDPCRAKGRTNVELREQFILPEGASQAMATFRARLAKEPGALAALGPITKIREKTDRSMPMSPPSTGAAHSRPTHAGSPSDYFSESESSRTRSRLGPATPTGRAPSPRFAASGSRLAADQLQRQRNQSRSADQLARLNPQRD